MFGSDAAAAAEELNSGLQWLEAELAKSEGPLFLGQDLTLVSGRADAAGDLLADEEMYAAGDMLAAGGYACRWGECLCSAEDACSSGVACSGQVQQHTSRITQGLCMCVAP